MHLRSSVVAAELRVGRRVPIVLRSGVRALSGIPSSVLAASTLDWPVTKFNRKLDSVCAKLARHGFEGLHGGAAHPALNRRTRLVQIVVKHGIVSERDLTLLPGADR